MIDIRDRVTSIFDLFDASIESEKTVDDISALCKELDESLLCYLLNKSFMNFLGQAYVSGWNKSDKSLGKYIEDLVLEESKDNANDIKILSQSTSFREMLDAYGEAFKQGANVPILVLRDKDTGKVIGHDEDVHPAIRDFVLNLLAAHFEQEMYNSARHVSKPWHIDPYEKE